jgi:CRISPR/Cas system-associated protein endoribonuclease Cas2
MTVYIEDLIERMAGSGKYLFDAPIASSATDRTLFYSFSNQIINCGLTEKQKKLCVSILKKYSSALSKDLNLDVEYSIKNNIWRTPSRNLSSIKKIEIVKKNGKNSYINFVSPYDPKLIEVIKAYKKSNESTITGVSTWNSTDKTWTFPLSENSIKFFATTDIFDSFEKERELLELYQDIEHIEKNIEQYIPMVSETPDGGFVYLNVSKNIPQPTSRNIINVLLHARKYGITIWTDRVNELLKNCDTNKIVKKFLEIDYSEKLCPSSGEFLLDDFSSVIDEYDNILFVIPVNHEIKFIKKTKEYLIRQGYKTEQMSVLFRLESMVDLHGFNQYVRDSQLNNELSDEIKFVFVSSKLPKPLMESRKKFDLVINFGLNSSHYSLQNFLKEHHNVITMYPTSGKDKHVQL